MNKTSLFKQNTAIAGNVFWLVFGVITFITNFIITLSMFRSQRESTIHRVNLLHLAMADSSVGLLFSCIAVKELYFLFHQIAANSTVLNIEIWVEIFCVQVSIAMTFCVLSHRFLAVVCATVYRNHLSLFTAHLCNVIFWVVTVIIATVGVAFINASTSNFDAAIEILISGNFFIGLTVLLGTFIALTLLEFIALKLYIRNKIANAKASYANVVYVKQKLQTHVLGSLKYVISLQLITVTVSIAVPICLAWERSVYFQQLCIFFVGFINLRSLLNGVVLIWKDAEIRTDVLIFVRLQRADSRASSYSHRLGSSLHANTATRNFINQFRNVIGISRSVTSSPYPMTSLPTVSQSLPTTAKPIQLAPKFQHKPELNNFVFD